MKSRQWYIDAVKVKMEEISPFDEPEAFIAADGDADYANVKPIKEYIEKNLDEATHNCLQALPLTLLHADVARTQHPLSIDDDGVATFPIQPDRRFIRFRHADLERDITMFITSEDPQYLVMQNKHVRPKQCKTMAVVSSDVNTGTGNGQMEIYTLQPRSARAGILLSIDLGKKVGEATDFTPPLTPAEAQAQLVQSPIEELIVLECARIVFNILKDYDGAKACENEQQTKKQALLQ